MGLQDLTPDEDEEDPGHDIAGVPPTGQDEPEEDLEEFKLPLLVMVRIEATDFAQAVKQLKNTYEPLLAGTLYSERNYMEPEIPEDINRYRDE